MHKYKIVGIRIHRWGIYIYIKVGKRGTQINFSINCRFKSSKGLDLSNSDAIIRQINGGLKSCLHHHGPIDKTNYSSASKRIYCQLKDYARHQYFQ